MEEADLDGGDTSYIRDGLRCWLAVHGLVVPHFWMLQTVLAYRHKQMSTSRKSLTVSLIAYSQQYQWRNATVQTVPGASSRMQRSMV
jgi:hypothetical protein